MNSWRMKNGKPHSKNTYLDVFHELDRLAILAEVFALNVPENVHAVAADQTCVESVGCEAAGSETALTPLFRTVLHLLIVR